MEKPSSVKPETAAKSVGKESTRYGLEIPERQFLEHIEITELERAFDASAGEPEAFHGRRYGSIEHGTNEDANMEEGEIAVMKSFSSYLAGPRERKSLPPVLASAQNSLRAMRNEEELPGPEVDDPLDDFINIQDRAEDAFRLASKRVFLDSDSDSELLDVPMQHLNNDETIKHESWNEELPTLGLDSGDESDIEPLHEHSPIPEVPVAKKENLDASYAAETTKMPQQQDFVEQQLRCWRDHVDMLHLNSLARDVEAERILQDARFLGADDSDMKSFSLASTEELMSMMANMNL